MRRLSPFLVGCAVLALPLTTFAAVAPSDTISVGGQAGTPQAGITWAASITEPTNEQTVENPISNSISGVTLPVLQGTVPAKDVYLVEADGVTVSDLVRLSVLLLTPDTSHDSLVFTMTSDLNPNLPATVPAGKTSIMETGQTQDITKLIFPSFYNTDGSPINGGAPYGVVVMSDADVPEPASLCLLAVGSLLLVRRRSSIS